MTWRLDEVKRYREAVLIALSERYKHTMLGFGEPRQKGKWF